MHEWEETELGPKTFVKCIHCGLFRINVSELKDNPEIVSSAKVKEIVTKSRILYIYTHTNWFGILNPKTRIILYDYYWTHPKCQR